MALPEMIECAVCGETHFSDQECVSFPNESEWDDEFSLDDMAEALRSHYHGTYA